MRLASDLARAYYLYVILENSVPSKVVKKLLFKMQRSLHAALSGSLSCHEFFDQLLVILQYTRDSIIPLTCLGD